MTFEEIIEDRLGNPYSYLKLDRNILRKMLPELERALIIYAIKRGRGNQSAASEILGLNRNTIRKRMAMYNINSADLLKEIKLASLPIPNRELKSLNQGA